MRIDNTYMVWGPGRIVINETMYHSFYTSGGGYKGNGVCICTSILGIGWCGYRLLSVYQITWSQPSLLSLPTPPCLANVRTFFLFFLYFLLFPFSYFIILHYIISYNHKSRIVVFDLPFFFNFFCGAELFGHMHHIYI